MTTFSTAARRGLLALACLAPATLVPLGSTAVSGGKIVFECGPDICVVNADGTSLVDVGGGAGSDLVLAPDGERVAFDRFDADEDGSHVYVMNIDGSGVRRVGDVSGWSPAWAPDGKRLAYAGEVFEDDSIYVVDVEGGTTRRVANDTDKYGLTWSADGTRIAYGSEDGLAAVRSDGSGPRTLLSKTEGAWRPAWSPDGTTVAFLGDGGLYVVRADGGPTRFLAEEDGNAPTTPVWSPDSRRILFARDGQIHAIDADGTSETALTTANWGEESTEPAWSPDGRAIAYLRGRYPGPLFQTGGDLWTMSADGGGKRQLVATTVIDGEESGPPRWGPGAAPAGHRRPAAARTIAVGAARSARTRAPAHILTATSQRTAFSTVVTDGECAVWTWTIRARVPVRLSASCGAQGVIDAIAVAGTRTAWILSDQEGNSVDYSDLVVGSGRGRPKLVLSADATKGEYLGNLVGDGSLTVFNTWRFDGQNRIVRPRLWRLVGTSRRLLASGPAAFGVVAVAGGRIAVMPREGRVVVLRADGRRVREFRLSASNRQVRLTTSRLFVVRGRSLSEYRLATGRRVRSWTLRAGLLSAPVLEDVDGTFAVYRSGIAVHVLKLADGSDRTLAIPNQGPPAAWQFGVGGATLSALEPQGLFTVANAMYSRQPGRVLFVPRRTLVAAFR